MKRIRMAMLVGLAGCSSFDGFDPQNHMPFDGGLCSVRVTTAGDPMSERYNYVVSLDSAIQGYGARSITTPSDTVVIEPILPGLHQMILRGVEPNCTVENGAERTFLMSANGVVSLRFDVVCTSAP